MEPIRSLIREVPDFPVPGILFRDITPVLTDPAAFREVMFAPTGGITAELAGDYLAHPAVAAVGGSWMVPPDLLAAGRWDEVTALCRATVAAVPGAPEAVLPGAVRR